MKFPNNTKKFMDFLNNFQENHNDYNLGNFDISVVLYPDLSYSINIEFVNFYVEIQQGIKVNVEDAIITPSENQPIEEWITISNTATEKILKRIFMKWIINNIEMFHDDVELTTTNDSN